MQNTYALDILSEDTRVKSNLNRLMFLVLYYVQANKAFYMGTQTIAKKLNVCTKTVKRTLKKLEQWGYITRRLIYNKFGRVKLRIIKLGNCLRNPAETKMWQYFASLYATGDKKSPDKELNINKNNLFKQVDENEKAYLERDRDKNFQELVRCAPFESVKGDLGGAYQQYRLNLTSYTHEQMLKGIQAWKRRGEELNWSSFFPLSKILQPIHLKKWMWGAQKAFRHPVPPIDVYYERSGDSKAPQRHIRRDDPLYKKQLEEKLHETNKKYNENFEKMAQDFKKGVDTKDCLAEKEKLWSQISDLESQIAKLV